MHLSNETNERWRFKRRITILQSPRKSFSQLPTVMRSLVFVFWLFVIPTVIYLATDDSLFCFAIVTAHHIHSLPRFVYKVEILIPVNAHESYICHPTSPARAILIISFVHRIYPFSRMLLYHRSEITLVARSKHAWSEPRSRHK